MSRINLKSDFPFNYLGSNIYHSDKTNKDYFNVSLFDSVSGDTVTASCTEEVFSEVSALNKLVPITCRFHYDNQYNRLYLIGFECDD